GQADGAGGRSPPPGGRPGTRGGATGPRPRGRPDHPARVGRRRRRSAGPSPLRGVALRPAERPVPRFPGRAAGHPARRRASVSGAPTFAATGCQRRALPTARAGHTSRPGHTGGAALRNDAPYGPRTRPFRVMPGRCRSPETQDLPCATPAFLHGRLASSTARYSRPIPRGGRGGAADKGTASIIAWTDNTFNPVKLDLRHTKVTEAGVQDLQKALHTVVIAR